MSFATDNIGGRFDIPQSTVSRIANEAYFEVADEWDSMEQELIATSSTTSGENRIELPGNFAELTTVRLAMESNASGSGRTSFHTLHRISLQDAAVLSPFIGGTPDKYTFYNSWIELFPSPNTIFQLQVRYKSHITDMIELTDVPSLETAKRPLVLRRLEEKLSAWARDFPAEAAARNRYLETASTKKDLEGRRQSNQGRLNARPIYGGAGRRKRRRKRFNQLDVNGEF